MRLNEGLDGVSSIGDEDQGGRSTRQHHPHCRCRNASGAWKRSSSPKAYELPDGDIFTVGADAVLTAVCCALAVSPGKTAGPTL